MKMKGSCIENEEHAPRLQDRLGGKLGKDRFDRTGKTGSSTKPTAGPGGRMGVMKLRSTGGGSKLGG